jgi:hypothetical protein
MWLKFAEKIRKIESLKLWVVFTHVSMIDDRLRDTAIAEIKQEFHIYPTDPCFFVDSVDFQSGKVVIHSQGTEFLFGQITEYFLHTRPSMMNLDRAHVRRLFDSLLYLAWCNKRKIATVLLSVSAGLFLRSRL